MLIVLALALGGVAFAYYYCSAHSGGARVRSFRYYQLFVQLTRATFGV